MRLAPHVTPHFFSPSGPRPHSPSVCVGTPPDPPRRHPPRPAERKDLLIDPKSNALAETVARSDELFSKGARGAAREPEHARRDSASRPHVFSNLALGDVRPRASPSLETGTETEPGTETGTHAFPSSPVPLAPPLAVKRARELNEDAITYVEIVGSAVEMAKRLGPRGAAAYHPREFCGRLCGVFVNGWDPQSQAVDDPGSFRWEILGSQVSPFFAEAPACARLSS